MNLYKHIYINNDIEVWLITEGKKCRNFFRYLQYGYVLYIYQHAINTQFVTADKDTFYADMISHLIIASYRETL